MVDDRSNDRSNATSASLAFLIFSCHILAFVTFYLSYSHAITCLPWHHVRSLYSWAVPTVISMHRFILLNSRSSRSDRQRIGGEKWIIGARYFVEVLVVRDDEDLGYFLPVEVKALL
jgi:hypothetical protein